MTVCELILALQNCDQTAVVKVRGLGALEGTISVVEDVKRVYPKYVSQPTLGGWTGNPVREVRLS